MSTNIGNDNTLKSVKNTSNGLYQLFNVLILENFMKGVLQYNRATKGSSNDAINYLIVSAFIICSGIVLYYSSNTPDFLKDRVYMASGAIFFLLLIFFFVVMKTDNIMSSGITLAILLGTIVSISLLLYIYTQLSATAVMAFNVIFAIVLFLAAIIGLALIYNLFSEFLEKQDGLVGFVIQFLFFIPCLFSDFIVWLFQQYQITPNIIFILLVLEISAILLYFYLPTIFGYVMENKQKNTILPGVVYLDKKSVIASPDTLAAIYQVPLSTSNLLMAPPTSQFNNFSISMWISLNPPQLTDVPINKEYTIFDFNSVLCNTDCSGGLPKVTFFFDGSNKNRETYNVYFTNNPNTSSPDDPRNLHDPEYKYGKYKLYLTNQRWNHFVFNYDRNICDLYINGVLERSMNLTNCLPILDISGGKTSLQMSTGQNRGLYGAICNVEYYTTPLTNLEIVTKYNLLMIANPPVYNTGI